METEANERSRSAVLGMKVISISEGLELGQIRQIVITPERLVSGFMIGWRHSREERLLRLAAVSSFGEDRVTIESQSLLERGNSFARQTRRMRGPLTLVGSRVFTAGGRVLGRVEEYSFSTKDGRLVTLEISGGLLQERQRLPAKYIIAISPQTVMIKDEALSEAGLSAGSIRTGIGSALGTLTEAAGTLADVTRQSAKKLSSTLGGRQPDKDTAVAVPDTETPAAGQQIQEERPCSNTVSQEDRRENA